MAILGQAIRPVMSTTVSNLPRSDAMTVENSDQAPHTRRFTSKIVTSGRRTFIVVPFSPDDVWGAKARHHITGSVDGFAVRGPLQSDGTDYVLTLGKAWLRDSGLEAGEEVSVVLSPEGPQREQLSPDIAGALRAEPRAQAFFVALATFYRRGYITWIEGARRPETRSARIGQMIELLKAGKKQR
jgi:hypothetical protein